MSRLIQIEATISPIKKKKYLAVKIFFKEHLRFLLLSFFIFFNFLFDLSFFLIEFKEIFGERVFFLLYPFFVVQIFLGGRDCQTSGPIRGLQKTSPNGSNTQTNRYGHSMTESAHWDIYKTNKYFVDVLKIYHIRLNMVTTHPCLGFLAILPTVLLRFLTSLILHMLAIMASSPLLRSKMTPLQPTSRGSWGRPCTLPQCPGPASRTSPPSSCGPPRSPPEGSKGHVSSSSNT